MLPDFFKFRVLNDTGQLITYDTLGGRIDATFRAWRFNAAGILVYSAELAAIDTFGAGDTLADAVVEVGTEIDNSTDPWLGLNGIFTVTTNIAGSLGDMVLAMEFPTDGAGSTYPYDATDKDFETHLRTVAVLTFDSDDQKSINFSL